MLALPCLFAVPFVPLTFGRVRGARLGQLVVFTVLVGSALALPAELFVLHRVRPSIAGVLAAALVLFDALLPLVGAAADALERRAKLWLGLEEAPS